MLLTHTRRFDSSVFRNLLILLRNAWTENPRISGSISSLCTILSTELPQGVVLKGDIVAQSLELARRAALSTKLSFCPRLKIRDGVDRTNAEESIRRASAECCHFLQRIARNS